MTHSDRVLCGLTANHGLPDRPRQGFPEKAAVLSCALVRDSERRVRVNKEQKGAPGERSRRQAMGDPLKGQWTSGQDVGLA